MEGSCWRKRRGRRQVDVFGHTLQDFSSQKKGLVFLPLKKIKEIFKAFSNDRDNHKEDFQSCFEILSASMGIGLGRLKTLRLEKNLGRGQTPRPLFLEECLPHY